MKKSRLNKWVPYAALVAVVAIAVVAVIQLTNLFGERRSELQFERVENTKPTDVPSVTLASVTAAKPVSTLDNYYANEDDYLSRKGQADVTQKKTQATNSQTTRTTAKVTAAAELPAEPFKPVEVETPVETAPDTEANADAGFWETGVTRYANGDVNLRSGGSLQSSLVMTMWRGLAVEELSTDGTWSKLALPDGTKGYALRELLVSDKPADLPATDVNVETPTPTPVPPAPVEDAYTEVNRTRYINAAGINLRNSDSIGTNVVSVLALGTEVTETAYNSEWSKVMLTNGTSGYVYSIYLSADAPAAPVDPPTEDSGYTVVDRIRYINADGVRVRSSDSTSASIVTVLAAGAEVTETAVGSSWSKVTLSDGSTGYIYSDYLSAEKPVVYEPTPDPEPVTPSPGGSVNPLSFVSADGSENAAWSNFNAIKSYVVPNGEKNYSSFTNNGDGTITVDGLTFSYESAHDYGTTAYDGVQCSIDFGDDPPYNRSTASGIPAQRGLISMKVPSRGGLPFGTVVFVEDYGLAVVADRGWLSSSTEVDLCYDGMESYTIRPHGWGIQRLYIISTP